MITIFFLLQRGPKPNFKKTTPNNDIYWLKIQNNNDCLYRSLTCKKQSICVSDKMHYKKHQHSFFQKKKKKHQHAIVIRSQQF